MQTYSYIYEEEIEEKFKKQIFEITIIMKTVVEITNWIKINFKTDINVNKVILRDTYKNEYFLQNKEYLRFLQKFLKGIAHFVRSLKVKIH